MAKTGRSLFLPGQFKPQLAWLGRNLPTLCMSLSRVGCTAQRCHSSSCLSIPLSPINPKRKVPRNLKRSGNMCPNVCDWHRRFVQKGQGWMMHSPTEFSNRQCTGGLWRRCCSVVREFVCFELIKSWSSNELISWKRLAQRTTSAAPCTSSLVAADEHFYRKESGYQLEETARSS